MKSISFRFLLLIGFTFIFAGCVNSYNISKRKPFNNYVGKTFELQRPILIVDKASIWTRSDGVPSILYAHYGLIDLDATNMGYGRVLGELPTGHQITIDSVRDEAWGDSSQITVYGRTTISPSTNEVSFVYPWGIGLDLKRAPWQ